jgi:hypothetical protein
MPCLVGLECDMSCPLRFGVRCGTPYTVGLQATECLPCVVKPGFGDGMSCLLRRGSRCGMSRLVGLETACCFPWPVGPGTRCRMRCRGM